MGGLKNKKAKIVLLKSSRCLQNGGQSPFLLHETIEFCLYF
jgi:hypothetical protein